MLDKRNIKLDHPIHKPPHVERLNKTLQLLLAQYMTQMETFTYMPVLQDIVRTYNTRVHRIIKMSPQDGEKSENFVKVRMAQEEYYHKATKQGMSGRLYQNRLAAAARDPLLTPNQYVRVQVRKTPFRRSYHQTYDTKFYVMKDKVESHLPIPMYRVNNFNGGPVPSRFYATEIQPYTSNLFNQQNSTYKA
jgi:hypothetical protein